MVAKVGSLQALRTVLPAAVLEKDRTQPEAERHWDFNESVRIEL